MREGGSVTSIIRFGDKVYGPVIIVGKCDTLIWMEPSETLRNASYLSKSGLVIFNTLPIIPFTISLGQCHYPSLDQILKKLNSITSKIVKLNVAQIVGDAGGLLAANVVMLGALFGTELLPVKMATIQETSRARLPTKMFRLILKPLTLATKRFSKWLNRRYAAALK
jgi:indolepyruvate ferredoxin oxidoreductase beta subunit